MFFSILLFSNGQALRQNTLNSFHSLKLTLSNSHLSISLPPARLDSQRHQPIEARRHQPTSWSISSNSQADPSPKSLIHALDPSLIHTSDPSRPSLMLSTLSNSHLWTFTSLSCRCRFRPDSPSGELSLSFSSTCLGFLIWVIGMINL